MSKKVDLLIIDPQNDFCDPKGTLYVNGADDDMQRLSDMIVRCKDKINDIHVTLDSHRYVDIAHPVFWKNSSGEHPQPFTIITVSDVENGVWVTSLPSLHKRSLEYVKTLEKNNRYSLCIWPYHCLIGSWGHNIYPCVFNAIQEWEKDFAVVDVVTKGSNIYTEHYSAIKADVPDPRDITTQINTQLIETLEKVDVIAVAGEANSHCLATTIIDIADEFSDDSYIKKLVYLEDASSPVGGFQDLTDDFVNTMVARGMQISNTKDFLS